MHRDRRRRPRHGLAPPGQLVEPPAAHVLRREGGRDLVEGPHEAVEGRRQRRPASSRRERAPPAARPSGRRSWSRSRAARSRRTPSRRRRGSGRGAWRGRRRRAGRRSRTGRGCRCAPRAGSRSARRTRSTMSCEVGPPGLSTTRTPSTARLLPASLAVPLAGRLLPCRLLVEEPRHPVGGVEPLVVAEVDLGGVVDAEAPAELAPHEAGRAAEGGEALLALRLARRGPPRTRGRSAGRGRAPRGSRSRSRAAGP